MGAFYGSIHFHTGDIASVKPALDELVASTGLKCLVSPPIRGWVGVFPHRHGQDVSVSEALSEKFAGTIVHSLVHDDSVFCYRLYRQGGLVEEYNSNPGYFGDEGAASSSGTADGLGAMIRELMPDASRFGELRELLLAGPDQIVFEQERLRKFAGLTGIPNTAAAYEDLQEGETTGVEEWKRFIHLPDLALEKASKKSELARVRGELKSLAGEGILLGEFASPVKKGELGVIPVFCMNTTSPGILISWRSRGFAAGSEASLMSVAPPWTGGSTAVDLDLRSTVHQLCMSPSGGWLGTGHASGAWKAEIWDWETRTLRFEVPHKRMVSWIAFSADERYFYSRSEDTIIVTDLGDGTAVSVIEVPTFGHTAAFHPDGSMMAADIRGDLVLARVFPPEMLATLAVGKPRYSAEDVPGLLDPNVFGKLKIDDRLITRFGKDKILEFQQKVAIEMKRALQSGEQVRVLGFTPDGQYLCCATEEALRVFNWEELLKSSGSTPPPVFVAAVERIPDKEIPGASVAGHIYSMLQDPVGKRMLFCGREGKVKFLSWVDGSSGELLSPPGNLSLTGMELSPDRAFLVCQAVEITRRGAGNSKIQVWSYPALCQRAGLDW